MAPKLAFDVDEATERFSRRISPAYAKVGKFATGKGTPVGGKGAGMLKRSLDRFAAGVREQGARLAETAKVVNEELKDPSYGHAFRAFGESVVDGARSMTFRTRLHLLEIQAGVKRLAEGPRLSKFFSREARTTSSGPVARMLPAIVLAGTLGLALTAGSIVSTTGHAMAASGAPTYDVPLSTSSLDPSTPGATATAHPISIRKSTIGFGPMQDLRMPGPELMQAALDSLTATFGNVEAAQAHLELLKTVLEDCIVSNCTVHTAGVDLDPVHQRYIVSMPGEDGYVYHSMEVAGTFVALAGQDGTEPVENPYAYSP